MTSRTASTLLTMALLLVAGSAVQAQEAQGPGFGRTKYRAAIRPVVPGEVDVDEYVQGLMIGERLQVTVTVASRSDLRPELTLIGPDGLPRTVGVKVGKGGRKLAFRAPYAVDQTGNWVVRIAGADGSEGDYQVAFKVSGVAKLNLQRQRPIETDPVHEFEGIDGAVLDLRLRSRSGPSVTLEAVRDPEGDDVRDRGRLITLDVRGQRSQTLRRAPLSVGSGTYSVELGVPIEAGPYDLRLRVRDRSRPGKRITLGDLEPRLSERESPIRGVAGVATVLNGLHFGEGGDQSPTVFFGGVAGRVVARASDGTSVTVIPPEGRAGSRVSVVVRNPDGQSHGRAEYFEYARPPALQSLRFVPSNQLVDVVSTNGGPRVRLSGAGFTDVVEVRLGPALATPLERISDGELRFDVPASPSGGVFPVTVEDAFGRQVVSGFTFTYKAPPAFSSTTSSAYSPQVGPIAGGITVTISGEGFESTDELLFDGEVLASTFVDENERTFVLPARAAGAYPVALRDRLGVSSVGPDFTVKAPAVVTAVDVIGGPTLASGAIPVGGGNVVRLTGSNFHPSDTLSLGGVVVTADTAGPTTLTFTTPATIPGDLDLVVRDDVGQETTVEDALHFAGFVDATSSRLPRPDGADDFSAGRAALGDLDGDDDPDLVIVSPYGSSPGTRTTYTRILKSAAGSFTDVTGTAMSGVGGPSGSDPMDGSALALGDLDGDEDLDVVVAGQSYFAGSYYYDGVRLLTNDGAGNFSFDATRNPPSLGVVYKASVTAVDPTGASHSVFDYSYGYYTFPISQAVALGDLDQDGDDDVVVGNDKYAYVYVTVRPSVVDFTQSPPYVSVNNSTNTIGTYYYLSGTRILENQDGKLVDATARRVPFAGAFFSNSTAPAFHARDLAIGDVDGRNGPDIVLTWDDPTTVSPYGMYTYNYNGASSDTSRVATRVLLNDGSGNFTDGTRNWIPAGTSADFWQADRMLLVDLLGSSLPDVLLLGNLAPSTSRPALRLLRNDGLGTGFTDVTSTAFPGISGASNDTLTGDAIAARDVDGDGRVDILVGTVVPPTNGSGTSLRATRLLRNQGNGTWRAENGFLPSVAQQQGEAQHLLLGDVAGSVEPELILVTETLTQTGVVRPSLRIFDWRR